MTHLSFENSPMKMGYILWDFSFGYVPLLIIVYGEWKICSNGLYILDKLFKQWTCKLLFSISCTCYYTNTLFCWPAKYLVSQCRLIIDRLIDCVHFSNLFDFRGFDYRFISTSEHFHGLLPPHMCVCDSAWHSYNPPHPPPSLVSDT